MSKSKQRAPAVPLEPLSPRERGRGEGTAEARHLTEPEPSSVPAGHLLPGGEGAKHQPRHSRSSQPPKGGSSENDEGATTASDIFHCPLPSDWKRIPISANYRITKKARGLVPNPDKPLPFMPMECVPAGGQTECRYELRKPSAIASGTYFEAGDVLLSKITPSFENGKQGIASNLPYEFGYGSTEIIPLQACTDEAINLYLFYLLLHHEVRGSLTSKMEGSTGRKRVPEGAVRELEIPVPPKPEQQKIAAVLWKMQRTIATQNRLIAATRDLKQSAMQHLFTHGLRGEPLKDTEIGLMPESWSVKRLDTCCNVLSSSLSYSDLLSSENVTGNEAVTVHGIKVSDMNLPGNELEITHANLIRHFEPSLAERKTIPTETVVFPKRGAAIATNKKRLTTTWTVLDPNLIGVRPKKGFDHCYLFHWFEQFDLRTITESGPTPQLNKKNLTPLQLPVPATEDEQRDIAAALATLDRKLAHHQQKRTALNDLFQTTLHQLMTAQIRVADLDIDISEVADHVPDAENMIAGSGQDHFVDANEMIADQSRRPRR